MRAAGSDCVRRAVSRQIQAIFADYTPLNEPLSLDEAYLDVSQNLRALPSAWLTAKEIRGRIFAETGLTASAGVSYNKVLAKLAQRLGVLSRHARRHGVAGVPRATAASSACRSCRLRLSCSRCQLRFRSLFSRRTTCASSSSIRAAAAFAARPNSRLLVRSTALRLWAWPRHPGFVPSV